MNGNTPYVGQPGDEPDAELTGTQRRALQERISIVAAQTREFLPDEYVVGSNVGAGPSGVRVTVSVQPPVGSPVSAGFDPDLDEEELIPTEDIDEVARGLAASAALQVKRAMGDSVVQTAR